MNDSQVVYIPTMCETVVDAMKNGALLPDVAKLFGVDEVTLTDWRDCYPEFNDVIERGLAFSEAWWAKKMRLNLGNPDYDVKRACEVMETQFGWER